MKRLLDWVLIGWLFGTSIFLGFYKGKIEYKPTDIEEFRVREVDPNLHREVQYEIKQLLDNGHIIGQHTTNIRAFQLGRRLGGNENMVMVRMSSMQSSQDNKIYIVTWDEK